MTGRLLYASIVLFLLVTALTPRDFFTWALEVSWVVVGLGLIPWLASRGRPPTPLLTWGLWLHAVILIYGAWYTYEHVPLGDWAAELCGWERNHYDRLGHFAQGFLPALLIREVLVRNRVVAGPWWLELIVFATCMAFTALFEIIEFAAALAFGDGAQAYLGSQGDVWDAQWDMVFCGLGALCSQLALRRIHRRQLATALQGSDRASGRSST